MSNNLGRTETTAGQNQKEVTLNASDADLDAKLTEIITLDFTSGDVTLTADQFQDNATVQCTNLSVARALNMPVNKGFLLVDNSAGTEVCTVTTGSSTVEVPAGEVRLVYQDGTTNGLVNAGGGGGGVSTSWELNNQAGTSYTFAVDDPGKVVRSTNASATTFTIDDFATIAIPVGSWIRVVQGAAGVLTISNSAGVTLKGNGVSGGSATLAGLDAGAVIYHESTDVWFIEGNLQQGNTDLNGNDLILDADGDTFLHETSDDNIGLVGGVAGEFVSFDGVNGRVGIGETTPEAALEVRSAISGDQIRIGSTGTEAHRYQVGRNTTTGFLQFQGGQAGLTGYTFKSDDGTTLLEILDSGALDTQGNEVILDADGDSSIREDGDDNIKIKVAGVDNFNFRLSAIDMTGAAEQFMFVNRTGSGVNGNFIANWTFQAQDASGNPLESHARVIVQQQAATAGSEDALIVFQTVRAGALATRLEMGAGLYHPLATGGDKGDNTINFGQLFDDNNLLTCYVADQFFDGTVSLAKWDAKVPDRTISNGPTEATRIKTKKVNQPKRVIVIENDRAVVKTVDHFIDEPVLGPPEPVYDEKGRQVFEDYTEIERDRSGKERQVKKKCPVMHRRPVMEEVPVTADKVEVRKHEPLRKFLGRIGTPHDPLTLEGYWAHFKEKRHLTSMPNEEKYDPVNGKLDLGSWQQRVIETVELHTIHDHLLHELIKKQDERIAELEALVATLSGSGGK